MNFATVHRWILQTLEKAERPFLLGINGPQGAGKSTLSAKLCSVLGEKGLRALTISIDDFYLTRHFQVQLAAKYPGNRYLQQRGYPGTHDIPLGTKTLKTLNLIPRYDKSAHEGKGDRMPEAKWTPVSGDLDLVILEGWMLGFTPVPAAQLPNQDFRVINEFLPSYGAWHDLLHGFLQLKPDDHRHVLTWRVEAEEKMKASGKPGMTKAEVTRYAELFMPAYETYLPGLAAPPVKGPHLVVPISKSRLPLS